MDFEEDSNMPKIGKRIRKLREAKEYSQEYIANELNMSISGYSRIERDEVKLTLDKLFIICRILNVRIDELIENDEVVMDRRVQYQQTDSLSSYVSKSIEEIYQDQIQTLKEEIRYLREILSKLT